MEIGQEFSPYFYKTMLIYVISLISTLSYFAGILLYFYIQSIYYKYIIKKFIKSESKKYESMEI
jgi:hypothetical protein